MEPSLKRWLPAGSISKKIGLHSMRVVGEVLRIVTQTFLHLNIGWNGVSEEVDFRQNFPELSITAQKHLDVFSSNSDESGVFHVMGEKKHYMGFVEKCVYRAVRHR